MTAPRRFENPGFAPVKWPSDTRLGVEWRNGSEARSTYTVDQLRWTKTGHDFDISRFWRA